MAQVARPADRRAAAGLGVRHLTQVVPLWVLRDVVAPFLGTRLLLTAVGLLAIALLPMGPFPGYWSETGRGWLDTWSRWDGRWYLSVVRDGYGYVPGEQSNVAFSPLYPLLMHAGGLLFGAADEVWLLTGIAVSNVALVVALGVFVQLVRIDFDEATARRTALYLLLFPTSLFLSAVYADSLYLALTIGAFYAARRERWWLAGGLGSLAALARPHGFLVLAPLAFEYLAQRRFDLRQIRPNVVWLGLIPGGLAVWAAHLYNLSGDPWLFVKAQSGWGRQLTAPWDVLRQFFSEPLVAHGGQAGWDHSMLDLGFTLLFLALVVATWRWVRPSYALYATLLFIPMITNGALAASMRYGLALFPVFIILALAGRHPAFHQAYLVAATGFATFLMTLFALGFWVA
ncbi:MAG: hypothetical protein HY329_23465 [Chloroflexi bacterium]|nr:hypothetical protein [Chloroflexota bacterium]